MTKGAQMDAVLSPVRTKEDLLYEDNLRPRTFEEFIGQETIKSNLNIFIEAAKKRDEHLDHVLNGIAYDSEGKRIFVTGKMWPQVFEIKLLKTQ